jgi:pimeloyl-ACP methyl ester carboxylesterase
MQTRTLEAPGASLYYEVRGSGPVLLMIPGGPMDAAGFAPLADILADRYTAVLLELPRQSHVTTVYRSARMSASGANPAASIGPPGIISSTGPEPRTS